MAPNTTKQGAFVPVTDELLADLTSPIGPARVPLRWRLRWFFTDLGHKFVAAFRAFREHGPDCYCD